MADCFPCWLQLKESQQREQALSADLEAAKKAQQEAQQQLQQAQSQVQAARDAPMATPSPSHRSMENGILSPATAPACMLILLNLAISYGSCACSLLVHG